MLTSSLSANEKKSIRTECEKFIRKNENLSKKFNLCHKEGKERVLDYLPTGKGKIPYQMVTRFDSLGIAPEEGYIFLPHHFYSSLKDDVITREEYVNVKQIYQAMKLKDLGELNKIYNFQDTIILCEIFDQRSEYLQRHFKYNLHKCNSASSFSGCVHRDKSKCMIVEEFQQKY